MKLHPPFSSGVSVYIACDSCQRQYDVGDLPLGSRIRCHCGLSVVVPEIRARDAEVLHCSACGGHVERGATGCDYCGASLSSLEGELGPTCPECYARMIVGARFCRCCGVQIRAEMVSSTKRDWDCPRCDGKLVDRAMPGGAFTECVACGGIWLSEESFTQVVEEKDQSAHRALVSRAGDDAARRAKPDVVKYIPCPICDQLMHRKNFAGVSGVIVDWCKGHGYWFDCHELENIMSFVRSGGMDAARDRQIREAERRLERAQSRAQSPYPAGMVDTVELFDTRSAEPEGLLDMVVRLFFRS